MRTVMAPLDTVSQALLLLVAIKQPTRIDHGYYIYFPMIYPHYSQLILGYWDTDGQVGKWIYFGLRF